MKSLLREDLRKKWLQDPGALTAGRIRRTLARESSSFPAEAPRIRIALIGSFTFDTIRDTFEVACLDAGLVPEIMVGSYGQYAQELLDPAGPLYAHRPEITFLMLDQWAVLRRSLETPGSDPDGLKQELDEFLSGLEAMVRCFDAQGAGLLVIHNLDVPAYDVMAGQAMHPGSISWAVRSFNQALLGLAKRCERVRVLDYDLVASRVGKPAANDEKMRLLGRFCVSHRAVPALVHVQMGLVKAVKGLTRKCIAVDLDNTLWGGIIGEDGLSGIQLGPTPPGNAYQEFQKLLLGFYRRGVILAINSRNNPEDALRVLREHPHQVLHEEHFGAIRINWSDKASNLAAIAEELNIGLDSVVFIDDDRLNRELVRSELSDVLIPEWPEDASLFCRTLLELNDFEILSLTREDRMRGAMYAAERSRRVESEVAVDVDGFLARLEIRIRVAPADEFSIPRVAQLTQRTNQFNMTTRRYTPAEVQKLAASSEHRVLEVSATDRYGDMGIVGAAILRQGSDVWDIDTFLMSCRVLGRRIEDSFLWWIAREATKAGAATLRGEITFTKKNAPARGFYERMGFRLLESSPDGQVYAGSVAELVAKQPQGVTIE